MRVPMYRLTLPEFPRSCVVFSSPHSGAEYPADFLAMTRLDERSIRSSEDAFVDELFADAALFGAPMLAARLPRAYVDLNRAADELDPSLVKGARVHGVNLRISAGLGVIPRVVGHHQVIRSGKMSLSEAEARITMGYRPYHAKLKDMVKTQVDLFGVAVLLDCHSMPCVALENAPLVNNCRAEVVIGDCNGTSCSPWISDIVAHIFESAGFSVARNTPFSGGYITKHYGRPADNIHAVQIEIVRSVYMDEAQIVRKANFSEIQKVFSRITQELSGIGCVRPAIAAE